MTHSHLEEEIEGDCKEEREGSLIPIFPPLRFGIVRIFPSSVMWFNKSETSTHSHPKEEIEGGREEERKSSSVPIFPLPSSEIVRLLTG